MTTPTTVPPLPSARAGRALRLSLKIAGSAVFAFAMAYRNVAIAGPAAKEAPAPAPLAAYSAPASEGETAAAPVVQQSLIVMVDHLQRLSFADQVKTVLIGNPAIADVTMISKREAVVSAKTVGSTNLFFLDADGRALGDYEVVVREGEARRVVLRRGPGVTEAFQCAPRCERTLSQTDTAESHQKLQSVVAGENKLAKEAVTTGDAQTTGSAK